MKTLLILLLSFILISVSQSDANENTTFSYEVEKVEVIKEVKKLAYDGITGTVYNAVAAQCDSDPLTTADLSVIDPNRVNELRWVALSRDLINDLQRKWKGKIKFGDKIYIDSPHPEINGYWYVHDTMNKRYTNRMDFLRSNDITLGKWYDIKIHRVEQVTEIEYRTCLV